MRFSFFLFFFIFILATSCFAQDKIQPWRLQADRLQADEKEKSVEGFGNVILEQGKNKLRADYIRYFPKENKAILQGNVSTDWKGDTFLAEKAEFDLNNLTGSLNQCSIFFPEPHLYLKADQIKKTGGKTYEFQNAFITGCDNKPNPWSLISASGEIELDGYAWLYNPKFQITEQNVFYSPLFIIPIKTNRESGLLQPQIGHNDRCGIYYNQPIFIVLNQEHDITLYENLMTKRGFMQGLEYQHATTPFSFGMWQLDWLHDHETARSEAEENLQFQGDGLIRPNVERYWFRSKMNARILDFDIKLDTDFVSDQNYLREFNTSLTGDKKSLQIFQNRFGRGLKPNDELLRPSTLLIGKTILGIDLFAKTQYLQNLRYMNDNLPAKDNPTVQILPELALYSHPKKLPGENNEFINWDFLAESGYYWRQDGRSDMRIDLMPRLIHTARSSFGNITAKVGWIQSTIHNPKTDKSETKGALSCEIDFMQKASKIYSFSDNLNPFLLRHSIIPRISYIFIRDGGQQNLPSSVSKPNFTPRNKITYSFSNIFTTKTVNTYRDLLQWNIKQNFDVREAQRDKYLEKYERRPFSDILSEIIFTPQNYFELHSKTFFSPYTRKITEDSHGFGLFAAGLGRLDINLDLLRAIDEYKRNYPHDVKILKTELQIELFSPWTLQTTVRYDLKSNTNLDNKTILSYNHQCFSLALLHEHTSFDNRFEILFSIGKLWSDSYAYSNS